MAPSIYSRMDSEEDMLDAEIMKAIRNSLKELNITSPSRPSRPPPGAVAHDENNQEYSDEDVFEDNVVDAADCHLSMITKASEVERDLQQSLKDVLVIKEDDNIETTDDFTDDDQISEATLASSKGDKNVEVEPEEKTTMSSASTVHSQTRKSKSARLKEAIEASLADISRHSSRPMTPDPTSLAADRPTTPSNPVTGSHSESTDPAHLHQGSAHCASGPDGRSSPTRQTSRGTTPTPPPIVPVKATLTKEQRKGMYRPVVIDGSSIGFAFANHDRFCAEGLRVTYECFKCLGYDDEDIVIIFKHIPQHYKSGRDQAIIDYYHQLGVLHYCPSRYAGDILIKSNDDLFLLKTATELEGVVLSSDRYREYWDLYPEYQAVIMNRLIQPTFIKDQLILPLDPMGDQGPELDQVLRFTE